MDTRGFKSMVKSEFPIFRQFAEAFEREDAERARLRPRSTRAGVKNSCR